MRRGLVISFALFLLQGIVAKAVEFDWPTLKFTAVATGVSATCVTHAGDGSGRLFIVNQSGYIQVWKDGNLLATPFLDLSSQVKRGDFGAEVGMYSIAFPSGFSTNKHFYLCYSRAQDMATVISRFQVSSDPNIADAASEQVILAIPKFYPNHFGGQMAFGPDGYLYISVGDAGSEGDPLNSAQDTSSLFGKILRIDVESGAPPYVVPANNPFTGNPAYRPEIWALGLRNPWRFSFDRDTGDLFIADVGGDSWEEIDFQAHSSRGGENYGWRIKEGNHDFNPPTSYDTNSLTPPIWEYSHNLGKSVIGGYMVRATDAGRMKGFYFYGDYITGRIWALKQVGSSWTNQLVAEPGFAIATFGEDEAGHLLVSDFRSGAIYRIDEAGACGPPTFDPGGNIYNQAQMVTLSSFSPGAVIHFTTNGNEPTEGDPVVDSGGAVLITNACLLKAQAFRNDLLPSQVTSNLYRLKAGTPGFLPAGGLVTNSTLLTITNVTPGAEIRYTLDGSAPNAGSLLYTQPFPIDGNLTVTAIAFKAGYETSYSYCAIFAHETPDPVSISVLAGTGRAGYVDGSATNASFSNPQGICLGPDGAIYVADSGNNCIRRITADGNVSTFAGTNTAGYKDGNKDSALFSSPTGVCTDAQGNFFVADAGNYRIRKIDVSGLVTTFAGSGTNGLVDSGVGTAQFSSLSLLKCDFKNKLFVRDSSKVRTISGGSVTTLSWPDNANGVLLNPTNESVYISGLWSISELKTNGQAVLFAGSTSIVFPKYSCAAPMDVYYHDDNRLLARFFDVVDMAADRLGNFYTVEPMGVRRISPNGNVSTYAALNVSGFNPGVTLSSSPTAVCVDTNGIVYYADNAVNQVVKISPLDWDEDGIPDVMEGGSTPYVVGVDDRLVDSDGDGLSNAAEFIAGTDPLDAASVFSIGKLKFDDAGHPSLTFKTETSRVYRIEMSTDLVHWCKVSDSLQGTGETVSLGNNIDFHSLTGGYYRIAVTRQ